MSKEYLTDNSYLDVETRYISILRNQKSTKDGVKPKRLSPIKPQKQYIPLNSLEDSVVIGSTPLATPLDRSLDNEERGFPITNMKSY